MDGPKGVVDHLVDRLAGSLPAKLAELRTRYTLAANDLPPPVQCIGWEPESDRLDELPAVYVIEQTTAGLKRQGQDAAGNTIWLTDTPCFVTGIVSGTDYQSTALARQMYTLAIREILLQRSALDDGYRLIIDQYREAHGEIARGDTAIVHGVRVSVVVRAEEHLAPYVASLGPIGPSGIEITTHLIQADTPTIPPPT